MDVELVTFSKKGKQKTFKVDSDSLVIGRGVDVDMRIPLGNVSRNHCKLIRNGEKVKLKDLNSSNGTFVNEQQVLEATLSAGDRIRIGGVVFTVRIDGLPAEIKPTPPVPATPTRDDTATKDAAEPTIDEEEFDIDELSDLDLDEISDADSDDDLSDVDLDDKNLDEIDPDDLEEIDSLEELSDDDLIQEDPDELPNKK